MRTTIGIATFFVVGAGAVGVSALSLKGSDTLKDLTVTLLTSATLNGSALDCGGIGNNPVGTLSYEGTGSGNGQAAMIGAAQDVAPMSSRLSNAVCTASTGKAEGIVFALDGISIVGNKTTFQACAGSAQLDPASCGQDSPAAGLAFSGTLTCNGGYALTDWKDVLRLIYFGFEHTTTTDPNAQNCNDPCRVELANTYSKVFQASCAPGNSCSQVKHAFRRNDESGTTDVFIKSIAGFPGIDQPNSYSPFCNSSTTGPKVAAVSVGCTATATANDGICSRDSGGTTGTCNVAQGKCTKVSCDADSDCTDASNAAIAGSCDTTAHACDLMHVTTAQTTLANHVGGAALNEIQVTSLVGEAGGFVDMQDGDIIRRTCNFSGGNNLENVCSADGKLGLVLPIWDATSPDDNVVQTDAFPSKLCDQGKFTCTSALRLSRVGGVNHYALCPDGFDPNVANNGSLCGVGQCYVPFSGADQDFRCLSGRGNLPPNPPAATVDGRAYNLTVWRSAGAPGAFAIGRYPRSTGQGSKTFFGTSTLVPNYRSAYFRLHQSNVIAAGSATCQKLSATDQIGCLVQASPCSIGYAGNSAVVGNTIAINVNNTAPSNACIQNLLSLGINDAKTYKISRNLYLNAVNGFESLTGTTDKTNELKLAKCYSDANIAESVAVNQLGFVPLPTGQAPFCDDVALKVCTQTAACPGNPAGIPSTGFGGGP
jgi:ABC-type phosphate transport system substrate-binding protein